MEVQLHWDAYYYSNTDPHSTAFLRSLYLKVEVELLAPVPATAAPRRAILKTWPEVRSAPPETFP